MQHKCKLSFSVLMISSCLVQIANAEEALSALLNKMIVNEKVVPKDQALIITLFSNKTTIENGGIEIVENGGTSKDAVVNLGGKQIVTRKGTAISTKIDGGQQFIFEERSSKDFTNSRLSSAYQAIVHGKDETVGQQNVYDGGHAWDTKVMGGGEQNLYRGHKKEGGVASNTTVFKDGRQHVLDGGSAKRVTLYNDAVQVVYPGGSVENLTINDHAYSWVYAGAELKGETKVNGNGRLHFYVGDATSQVTQKDFSIQGRSDETLFFVGSRGSKDNPNIHVENLSGNGTISFSSIGYDPHHSSLHVERLSGNLHFHFNTNSQKRRGDYLVINNGEGDHKISVVDSGVEITNFFARERDFITELNLITDKSTNGGANFILTDHSGNLIDAVDGGTYMYSLQKRAKSDNLQIWYLGVEMGKPKHTESYKRRVIKKPHASYSDAGSGRSQHKKSSLKRLNPVSEGVDLSAILSEEDTVKPSPKRRPPRHLSQNFSNSSNSIPFTALSLRDGTVELSDLRGGHRRSGRRRPPVLPSVSPSQEGAVETLSSGDNHQPSSEQHHPPVLLAVSPSQEGAVETLSSGDNHQPSSEQHHPPVLLAVSPSQEGAVEMSSLGDNRQPPSETQQPVISLAAPPLVYQTIEDPNHQSQDPPELKQELLASHFLTTPSTDAVLSMAVTPELIFNSELQSIRIGKGILDRNKKSATFWTYAIKNKEHLSTGHTDFKLDQTGVVLGINGLSELVNGEFYIGGFGSYNQARIAHARGGTSDINSYSIGTYATYFDHSGWYVDSVLKYNHYQNNLKAVSTNGISIQGDYKQWAVGTSFEVGYRFNISQSGWMQPYGQLTWLQVQDKEIKLSNGMTGDISPSTSLRSEIGLSLGYEFGSDMDTPSVAYIAAAWLRENIEHNHTTINKQHKFTTDLSGNSGKFGVGLSSFVSDRLKFYAEAYYLKGHKTKQLLQGILGVRYSF
ncbi:BafA family autotransporter [Bartonella sp. B35(2025)]